INSLPRTRNIASLPCEIVLGDLTQLLKSFFHQGFFAVKRRAVFILGAKCEAFHFAPRLFFYVFVFGSIHDSTTMQNLSPGFFPQNGGLLSVLSIPAIHAIISRCFLGLWEVCTFAVEKRRYIMKLVVEFLMSICHGVVVFVSCIGKLPRKLWRFNKKHHCISYDNNSIDSLYDWDDDDDF
ncbi:MAG: hypothetical protein SPJ46_01645, partial [Sodaliphilus sp.]|nr:hypothetical protein [Sodaliphilus sp.]